VAPIDGGGTSVGVGAMSVPDIGEALGSVAATRAFAVGGANAAEVSLEGEFVEAAFAFALDVEAGAEAEAGAESEAEAGVDAGAGRPLLSAAKADDPSGNPKTANNMAAMATLTSLSLGVGANARALSN
jgi:hypothetical protein